MRGLARVLFGVFLAVGLCSSQARANDPSDLPERFMQEYVAGRAEQAVDGYFKTNPLVQQKAQQLQYLKTQLASISQIFGRPSGYELVSQETLAPSLRRFVYITKHPYHAVTWEFYVYRPAKDWIGSNMRFDDSYGLLGPKK